MSASSVSGVGQGSSLGLNKGANTSVFGIERLIGTKIVLSGKVTLSGGTATVTFPQTLPGVDADYIVLTGGGSSYSYGTSLTVDNMTVNGSGSQVISYVIVRVTGATVAVPN